VRCPLRPLRPLLVTYISLSLSAPLLGCAELIAKQEAFKAKLVRLRKWFKPRSETRPERVDMTPSSEDFAERILRLARGDDEGGQASRSIIASVMDRSIIASVMDRFMECERDQQWRAQDRAIIETYESAPDSPAEEPESDAKSAAESASASSDAESAAAEPAAESADDGEESDASLDSSPGPPAEQADSACSPL
jgi:hypothetical protein